MDLNTTQADQPEYFPPRNTKHVDHVDVAVVDDHVLLAQSVVLTLRSQGMTAAAFDHRDPDLVERLSAGYKLVLMDLMLGSSDKAGLAATRQLVTRGQRVVVVTAVVDPLVHAECIDAGAWGVISKANTIETLVSGVIDALNDRPLLSIADRDAAHSLVMERKNAPAVIPDASLLASLTTRERRVLGMLIDGIAAGRIARDLDLSLLTVRTHIRSILAKLKVHTQLEAVTLALKNGWSLAEQPNDH